jgi:hypothetical protein
MKENELRNLFNDFIQSYDAVSKDRIWQEKSLRFRTFWDNKIIAGNPDNLKDDEIDEIIRILDKSGKGNKKDSETLTTVMIPQGAQRRIFHLLCSDKILSKLLDEIFIEQTLDKKIKLIDKFYKHNEGEKNYMTGKSGNAINTLLATYDPFNNLSIISLEERKSLMRYFEFPLPENFEKESLGFQFIMSNKMILDCFQKIGLNYSGKTIKEFCYSKNVRSLWKGGFTVKRSDKDINVTIPVDIDKEGDGVGGISQNIDEQRESFHIQALVSKIGSEMGCKIWLPKSDRSRILSLGIFNKAHLLESLPLSYDNTTMKTIENIDVLWLKGRTIIRAFEVEHTTSIYSGILRMADLLALIPNIDIKLHIVAPVMRKEKVFEEIQRPVFSLLERGAMSELCTYISYDSIRELSEEKYLGSMNDSVLDNFAETAE